MQYYLKTARELTTNYTVQILIAFTSHHYYWFKSQIPVGRYVTCCGNFTIAAVPGSTFRNEKRASVVFRHSMLHKTSKCIWGTSSPS